MSTINKLVRYMMGSTVTNGLWHSDGQSVYACSFDHSAVRLAVDGSWNVKFTGHTGQLRGLDVSPDGATLATGGCFTDINPRLNDHSVRFWDATTGYQQKYFVAPGGVMVLRFTPDGKFIIIACDTGDILMIRMSDFGTVWSMHNLYAIFSLEIRPGGIEFAFGDYQGQVKIASVATGDLLHEVKIGGLPFSKFETCVAYSYDGLRILIGSETMYALEFETTGYSIVFHSGKFADSVNFVGFKPLTYFPVVVDWGVPDSFTCDLNLPNLDLTPNLQFQETSYPLWFAKYNPAGTLICGGNHSGELWIAKPEAAPVAPAPPPPTTTTKPHGKH